MTIVLLFFAGFTPMLEVTIVATLLSSVYNTDPGVLFLALPPLLKLRESQWKTLKIPFSHVKNHLNLTSRKAESVFKTCVYCS